MQQKTGPNKTGKVGYHLKSPCKRMESSLLDLFGKKTGDEWESVLTELFYLEPRRMVYLAKQQIFLGLTTVM